MRTFMRIVTLGSLAAVLVVSPVSAADTTVKVFENGDGGWAFNPDPNTSTDYEFTLDEQSIGNGSLYVEPIGSDDALDKFIGALELGIATSELASVSYDFLIAGDGDATDVDEFYLNIYTNEPGSTTFYDCRFDYVPPIGSTADWTTATFSATDVPTHVAGSQDCPETLAGMPAGSTISFLTINVGDTSLNDAGLAGYLDKVVVELDGGDTTTYDFDVALAVKEACRDGGYADYGFANQGECISFFQANDKAGK